MENKYEIKYIELSKLIPYENNPRLNKNAVTPVANSIKEYGFKNPIVVDEDFVIINGHTRRLAAIELGLKEVPVIIANDLTEDQAKAFRLVDNKTAEFAEWDFEKLKNELLDLENVMKFDDFGFEDFDLNLNEAEVIEDDFEEELPVEPKSKLGDMYKLGRHRLMCGDSTSITSVERLMGGQKADMLLTDPPYNTGMVPNEKATRLGHMFNDKFTDEEWDGLLNGFVKNAYEVMKENSVGYIFLDWRRNHELVPVIKKHFSLSNIIVWDKVVHGLGSDYKYCYELINVCKKGKPELITNNGEQDYQDVWSIQRKIGKDDDHATKKPVELLDRILKHTRKVGNNILDLFGGSGSTLLACEQSNRNCFMMELDPRYVDVIIKRWEDFTGMKAELITE